MTEKTSNQHSSTVVVERPSDVELPTNRLTGRLEPDDVIAEAPPDVDWLSRLATTTFTESLSDSNPQHWEPAGMAQHTAAPRMVPTIGARLNRGLKKSFTIIVLACLSVGAVAAAGYGLLSTEWFAGAFGPKTAAPGPEAQKPPQVSSPSGQSQLPDIAQGGNVPVIEAPISGSAKELRDRGITEYKAGNIDEAIRLLEGSTKLDGDDAIAYHQLGLAYLMAPKREHSLEDAELAFRSAASLQPDWAAPQQGLAESLIRRNFYKEAVSPALEATRLDPTLGEAWMTLGRAYHGSGQEAEATRAFAQAARYSPPPLVQP